MDAAVGDGRVRGARLLAGRHFGIVDGSARHLGRGLVRADHTGTPARRRPPKVQAHPYAAPAELAALVPLAAEADRGVTHPHPADPRRWAVASPELVRDEIGEAAGEVGPGLAGAVLELDADLALAVLRELDTEGRVGRVAWPPESSWPPSRRTSSGGDACFRSSSPIRRGPCWRPVLTGPDAAWARVLASSMPPAGGGRRPRPRA